MKLRVRNARLDDAPAIRALLVETWHATYDRIYGEKNVTELTNAWHSVDVLRHQIGEASEEPPARAVLVAILSGQIVGTSEAHPLGEALRLGRLYVLPAAQRYGVGRRLLQATLRRFPDFRRVDLEVEPANTRAIAFYQRMGFEVVGAGGACNGDLAAAIPVQVMAARTPVLPVRPARDSDAQDLLGLVTLCFAEYPGCFTDPHGDMPDLLAPGGWPERRQNGRRMGGEFIVMEDGEGRVCACVAVDFPREGIAELHRLYVRPDCRGQGIGEALVRRSENYARKHGAGRLILWSDTRFAAAHRLYERLGYKRIGQPRRLGDISNSHEYHFGKPL